LWRNKWQNQDADAKWAVKKDAPAGKFGIKSADYSLRIAHIEYRVRYMQYDIRNTQYDK